jgi:ABC-type transport system involved in multi-copper enzyme maturation permease subunit
MKALLLKDFLNLRQQGKTFIVLIVVWLFFSLANKSTSFFSGVVAVMAAIFPVTALAYDERAKWDAYALTMPVSRAEMALSKYLLSLVLIVIGIGISTILNIFMTGDIAESLKLCLIFFSLSVFMSSAILPAVFKFGTEKGRLISIIIPFGISALIVLLSKINSSFLSEGNLELLLLFAPVIALAFAAVSILISINVYEKKEL